MSDADPTQVAPTADRRTRSDPPAWQPVPDPTSLTEGLVSREIQHVKELFNVQFALIERQRVESKIDTEKALAAALASQEKAAGVLATFTADQLKALGTSFTTSTDQIRKDIAELKEGARGEHGEKQGSAEARTAIYAVLGAVLTLITIGSLIFGLTRSAPPTQAPAPATAVQR